MSITAPQWKYRSRILSIQKHIWILASVFIRLLFRNRLNDGRLVYKDFDAAIGNVADDDVFKCVSMYMDGIWDEKRTLDELRYFRKNDQIAFLTQDVIDAVVKFTES